jgi:hypothetical protein
MPSNFFQEDVTDRSIDFGNDLILQNNQKVMEKAQNHINFLKESHSIACGDDDIHNDKSKVTTSTDAREMVKELV